MYAKALITAIVVALAGSIATQSEAGSTCKDVYIEAHNKTGEQIKVIDMHFKMSGVGQKSEPIHNFRVPKNKVFSITRNLEKAAGRNTRITVLYRIKKKAFGKTYWSKIRRGYSAYATCKDSKPYALNLREK